MATTITHGRYETVRLDADEHHHVTVGPGETHSNRLYDQTASGAYVTFTVTGGTLANIGIDGQYPSGMDHGGITVCAVSADAGETAIVTYCDFSAGAQADMNGYAEVGGVHVRNDHAGHAEIRSVSVAAMSEGGIIGSPPGRAGGAGGTVTVSNCYTRDCTVAGISLGTLTSVAKGCTIVIGSPPDAPVSTHDPSYRGLRGRYTTVTGAECNISVPTDVGPAASTTDGGTLLLRDGSVSGRFIGDVIEERQAGTPTTTPPRGVPASPLDAATGPEFVPGSIGVPTATGGVTRHDVPLYDPEKVAYPTVRTADPAGRIRALALTTAAGEASPVPTRAAHTETPNGPRAMALDDPILADFEDGVWPGDWEWFTSKFLVDGVYTLDGEYSLKHPEGFTDGVFHRTFNPTIQTARGTTYSVRTRFASVETEGAVGFAVCGGGTDYGQYYRTFLRLSGDSLFVGKGVPGADPDPISDETAVAGGVQNDTVYRLSLALDAETVTATVENPYDGTDLASVTITDDEYTAGDLGVFANTNSRFDRVMAHGPPPTSTATGTAPIETFESGVLSAWSSDDMTAFSVQSGVVHDGSYALRVESYNGGTDYLWSMPGDGLPYYPRPGDSFQFYVQPNATNDYHREELLFAKQAAGSMKYPSYGVNVHEDGVFYFEENHADGTRHRLDSASFTYEPGTWYRVEVDWPDTETIRARLIDDDAETELGALDVAPTLGLGVGGLRILGDWERNAPNYWDTIAKTN